MTLPLAPVTLHTERLTLRWLTEDDADAYYRIFSDPVVMRYWSSAPWTSMAQAHAAIADSLAENRSGTACRFGVVRRDTNELIGHIKLYDIHAASRRCDLGYALATAHWGHGYLAEAMRAALSHAFDTLDMNRIEADIDPRNEASAKVLEKMGFQKEGYMPERWIVNGEVCDTVFYGLLKRNWMAR
jgi:ribosomal-protein-alanine N-acetyltransferase